MQLFLDSVKKDGEEYSDYKNDSDASHFASFGETGVEYKCGLGTVPDDIGYLFVVLTNSNNFEISNISLISRTYRNPLIIEHENYQSFRQKNYSQKVALNDSTILQNMKSNIDTIRFAALKPNQSILWFLGGYKKKDDGLPEYYLTDLLVPERVEYQLQGRQYYDTIRKPYGEKAAKLFVPNGWYHQ